MKNYSNSKKWQGQSHYNSRSMYAPKNIISDGYFKIGDDVYFDSQNSFYDGDLKYLKCQIVAIRIDHNKVYEYRIVVYLPNNRVESFWTSKNKIRKENPNNIIDENKLKFKPGQKVFVSYDRHYECVIKSAEVGYANDIVYNTICINGNELKIHENYIKQRINDVDNGKFKVGDFVSLYHGPYYKTRMDQKSEIKRVFTYDDEDIVYYSLVGYYNLVMDDKYLIKSREPVIIFSDDDPYGEEDWGED